MTQELDAPHYLVTEQDGDEWYWYIDHPDDCLEPLPENAHPQAIPWRTRCGMDDFVEFVDREVFPEPPFRVPVAIHVEKLSGGPWGPPEIDAWLVQTDSIEN